MPSFVRPTLLLALVGALAGCLVRPAGTCASAEDCAAGACVSGVCQSFEAAPLPARDDEAPPDEPLAWRLERPTLALTDVVGRAHRSDHGAPDDRPEEPDPEDPGDPSEEPPDPCGNGALDADEECDGAPGCSPTCTFGIVVCDAPDLCHRAIDVAHDYGGGDYGARYEDVALVCGALAPTTVDVDAAGLAAEVGDHDINLCGANVNANVDKGALVITMRSLTMTGTLRFVGALPVVFLVYGDATIEGVISVDANGDQPGAGAGNCAAYAGQNAEGAGGGGSNGSTGGWGGGGNGHSGAAPNLKPLTSIEDYLRGGCDGGGSMAAVGGGGGGALQISVGATLTIKGRVSANGGGGSGGQEYTGGGGGGSGGDLFLQAARVVVDGGGAIVAQGGAGGSGGDPGDAGEDGPANPTERADNPDIYAGRGAGGAPWDDAESGWSSSYGGGGGGGGAGRIAIRAALCGAAGARTNPAPECL